MRACYAVTFVAGGLTTANAQALAPGHMIGWGDNSAGQTQLPILSPPLDNISAISATDLFTAALRNDGTVVVWGADANVVSPPQGLNDVKALVVTAQRLGKSGEQKFLMALRRNGTVTFSGAFPQSGPFIAGYLTNVTAIAAKLSHAMALKQDGTVVDWQVLDGSLISVTPGLDEVTAIAAGAFHALALKRDGTVVAWGSNLQGQTDVPRNLDHVVAIAASDFASFAVRENGSVIAWGSDSFGEISGAAGLTNIKAISAGISHALALTGNGEIRAWGDNGNGQTSVPPGLTNVKAIAAGSYNSFALNPAPLIDPYTFSGFQRPVDSAPTINIGRAGRTYPVKWQLKDGAGGFVSRLSAFRSLTSSPARCGAFLAQRLDLLETRVSGPGGLSYDSSSNQYVFNWKAPSLGCYTLFLTLDNDQVYTANFIIL